LSEEKQKQVADVYDALAANPDLFRESALVITYDEHGGFYAHVHPGPALNPDGQNSPSPDDRANFTPPSFAFDRIGLRIPTVVVSPWVAKGTVEHRQLQHTSIVKTVREMFGLNVSLNRRDDSAQSFADLFEVAARPRPPGEMPAKLDRASIEETTESVVAGIPLHPADEPLDELTREWSAGMLSFLAPGIDAVEEVATLATQGEAAALVDEGLLAAGL
jgi:phospholipase C